MKLKYVIIVVWFITSCQSKVELSSVSPQNWSNRFINIDALDSLEYGMSYLSIYSQMYSMNEKTIHNLTAMVSLRNTSITDSIYITNADYYDSKGKLVRKYFDKTIYLAPLETTEIIIDEIDTSGGTGANFIFEWKTPSNCTEPIFEGVMNSTEWQLGFSFITQAKRIK